MFAGQSLGFLTIQFSKENSSYAGAFEVSVPLLEGGLLYHGLFSPIDSNNSPDLLLYASKEVLDSAHVMRSGSSEIQVGLGKPYPVEEKFFVLLNAVPVDAQQFFGTVTKESTGEKVKFLYKDIHEPITFGTITLIVVGVAGILCATSMVIGTILNRECRKAEITYGFDFDWKENFKLGCKVRCIDE